MQLANFTPSGQDPAKPSGPAELGGIPVHAIFDWSNPNRTQLTIRHDMTPGAGLPVRLHGVDSVMVAGREVPVRYVELECGAGALQGRLDPALAEAAVGPAAAPADLPPPAAEAPAASEAGRDADSDDSLVALSRQRAQARRERAAHAERVEQLRAEAADLRERLSRAEAELSRADEEDASHAERCAGISQQIRDLLDDEETG